ncbi:hypothetical protein EB118_04380 [bacterium]|nr:hypothetical protein [bacterium]NBX98641.1 hypothetical protein [bacterium]NDC94078.1 hypothetical protein [bacterium]NDD83524.1 hypothetical protein [bacterium]NDG29325.1 hypothetical protein [bacterium]
MSITIHEALGSPDPKAALEELISHGGRYFKGRDIAIAVLHKISSGEPYYPPIFSLKNDDGEMRGFLEHFGVASPEELPISEKLAPYIGSISIVEVTKLSQARPHEQEIVGTGLPAIRLVFIETGQQTTNC